jgi:propanol-preferring alcohol dehydrogenase
MISKRRIQKRKMRAMVLHKPSKIEEDRRRPLKLEDVAVPEIGNSEVLIEVTTCGVCRTDLHVVEADLPPLQEKIIPGHETVGRVSKVGRDVKSISIGDRVGIPWLHHTCGKCEYCITGRENLCENKVYTGYTVNGGYAEYATGDEAFVFKLPKNIDPKEEAPLLCAGIIGYRAFKLCVPRPGGRIGFFGFGGSAHLILQLASKLGYETVAFSRNPAHIELAKDLGATETVLTNSGEEDGNPQKKSQQRKPNLDAAIVFAPAGKVVLEALPYLKKGGTLAIASIHMDFLPQIDYDRLLFGERKITSAEANTREDAREFLELATRLGVKSKVTVMNLDKANEALYDLKSGKATGALVLDCQKG